MSIDDRLSSRSPRPRQDREDDVVAAVVVVLTKVKNIAYLQSTRKVYMFDDFFFGFGYSEFGGLSGNPVFSGVGSLPRFLPRSDSGGGVGSR